MATVVAGFNRDRIYTMRATPERLLRDLEAIAALDARSERNRRVAITTAVVAAVVFVSSFVLPESLPQTLSKLMAIGAVAVFVVSIVMLILYGRTDFPNNRYMLFSELVRLLGRDMARDAELQVELDLAPPNVKRKRGPTGQAGEWRVVHYRDPWLRMAGRFADGTSFRIAIVELFEHRGRYKKTRSGKQKYKDKTKSATRVSVKLFPKVQRYGNLNAIEGRAWSFLKLPRWLRVNRLETTAESLTLVAVTKVPWTLKRIAPKTDYDGLEMVARMLLSLYQMMHVSKAASR